jgi:quercetin dioxygenase-like cupin family protein
MQLINEKDMEWSQKPGARLRTKNLLTDHKIGAGLLTCGVSSWPYGEAGMLHTHVATGQDEIYIVLRGEGRLIVNGEEHRLKPGDMFQAVCGEEHGMVEGLTPGGVEMFYMLVPTGTE